MKVYSITHESYSFSRWGGGIPPTHMGTYSTKELAQSVLDKAKAQILARWSDMDILDFTKDNKFGFSYSHPVGSMSFIPGAYVCNIQEILDEVSEE